MREADRPAAAALDAIKDLIERRPRCERRQLARQVLLQRLPAAFSSARQRRVDVLGNAAHKNIWHAYKMIATSPAIA